MSFTEDLSLFFADFGVQAVFTRSSTTIATCNVIFDLPTQYSQLQEVSMATDAGVILCRTSDITSVKRADTVTVNSVAYSVAQIRDGGSGVTHIDLEKF